MGNEQKQEIDIENLEFVFKTGLMFVMVGLVLLFIYISGCSCIEILIPAGVVGGIGIIAVVVSIMTYFVAKSQEPEVKDEEINKFKNKETNKFCELKNEVNKTQSEINLLKEKTELLQFKIECPSGVGLYSNLLGKQYIKYIKNGELKSFELPNNALISSVNATVCLSHYDHYALDEKTKIITKYRHDIKKDKDTLLRQYKFDQEEEILVGIETKTKKGEKK